MTPARQERCNEIGFSSRALGEILNERDKLGGCAWAQGQELNLIFTLSLHNEITAHSPPGLLGAPASLILAQAGPVTWLMRSRSAAQRCLG